MYFISSIFIDHGYEYAKDSFEKKVKKKMRKCLIENSSKPCVRKFKAYCS